MTSPPSPAWPAYSTPERAVRVFDTGGDTVERDPQADRRVAWAGADVMPKA